MAVARSRDSTTSQHIPGGRLTAPSDATPLLSGRGDTWRSVQGATALDRRIQGMSEPASCMYDARHVHPRRLARVQGAKEHNSDRWSGFDSSGGMVPPTTTTRNKHQRADQRDGDGRGERGRFCQPISRRGKRQSTRRRRLRTAIVVEKIGARFFVRCALIALEGNCLRPQGRARRRVLRSKKHTGNCDRFFQE